MERNERCRPALAGVSISHPRVTAGTFGCLLWLNGKVYIVSNSHILADCGLATLGDPCLQPGTFDGGEAPQDTIGQLNFFVPYDVSGLNKVDLATAEAIPEYVSDTILGLPPGGELVEVRPAMPSVGLQVVKSSRTTGLTGGTIISASTAMSVEGYPQGSLKFDDCFFVEGPCSGGDSGAAVISADTGELLGLLFAGDGQHFLAIKISNVLAALGQLPNFRPAVVPSPSSAGRWLVPAAILASLVVVGLVRGSSSPAARQR